ncbi:MAG: tRNA 2-thiouridine(34) synthase MnmA [Clostridia bacterium]
MKRVLLGMSGGVDSSVAAILLKEAGYEVIGATMKLWESDDEYIEGGCCNMNSTIDAKRVCDALDIPHYVLNFQEEFNKCVIQDFISEYKKCRTPNPCIECNKYLKFGAMYEMAKKLNCDYIATGHYAKTEYSPEYKRYVLKKSNAGNKDQSYVLYNLPKELAGKILFPLGNFKSKDEIRKIAEEHNLLVAKKPDSEDICFIPDGDYKKFLEENSNLKEKPGNIVTESGKVLGKHSGLYRYTIGQRKGLGIANPVPLFVKGFNIEKNELIVGEEKKIFSKETVANEINLILIDEITKPMQVMAKIRYSAKEAKATIYPIEEGKIRIEFEEPQRAITPGQSIVFYISDIVLGGGKII